ncbi:MAG: ABC transporter permease [Treponema sp.]|jgi:simple sugar transport system permease protein|nr:ABC transporter permease [Treponema sp.]
MRDRTTQNRRHVLLSTLDLVVDDKTSAIAIAVISILLSLIAAAIFLLLMKTNPFEAFEALLKASGFRAKARYSLNQGMLTDFTGFLGILAPMILSALGVIIAMRTGLFNIGISGQMIAAASIATVCIGYSGLPSVLAKPLVIVIGIVVGGALGALVGFLKYRFNINEVVSTIMINYIVNYVAGFFINTYYIDIITRSSLVCTEEARLTIQGRTLFGQQVTFPIGIVLAFASVFIIRFLLNRTTLGYELKAVGLNRDSARYAGIHVGSRMVIAMFISGMFAGLAGVTYYVGHFNTIVPKDLPAMGYDAIAVSLLGNLDPVGSIFASIIITIFQRGSVYMSSVTGVPKEITAVVTGIILVFSACGTYMRAVANKQRDRLLETSIKKQGSC